MFKFLIPIFVAVAMLSGCGKEQDDAICALYDVPTFSELMRLPQKQQLGLCVHRWAYSLATGPGANGDIAKATLGACRILIERTASEALMAERRAEIESARIDKIRPIFRPELADEVARRVEAETLEDALFRVAQARAGNCLAPKMGFRPD
jgi:hypothetical protein